MLRSETHSESADATADFYSEDAFSDYTMVGGEHGDVAGATAEAAATAIPQDGTDGKVSGLRITPFSGSRNPAHYLEWRKEVQAVEVLAALSRNRLAVMAWLALRGEARSLASHLSIEELNEDSGKGYTELIALLDGRYMRQTHELFDVASERYEKFRRRSGQSMQ